jgi:hypothetical protein
MGTEGEREMRKKIDLKRIENLEASVRSLKVEDGKRRHVEAIWKMSDEELASQYFALEQIWELAEGDPYKHDELFRAGLATTELLVERARLGWRRFCETGGQAGLVDFWEAIHSGVTKWGTPDPDRVFDILFEGLNPSRSRLKGITAHRKQLAREPEKKDLSENATSRPKEPGDDAT